MNCILSHLLLKIIPNQCLKRYSFDLCTTQNLLDHHFLFQYQHHLWPLPSLFPQHLARCSYFCKKYCPNWFFESLKPLMYSHDFHSNLITHCSSSPQTQTTPLVLNKVVNPSSSSFVYFGLQMQRLPLPLAFVQLCNTIKYKHIYTVFLSTSIYGLALQNEPYFLPSSSNGVVILNQAMQFN